MLHVYKNVLSFSEHMHEQQYLNNFQRSNDIWRIDQNPVSMPDGNWDAFHLESYGWNCRMELTMEWEGNVDCS